MHPEVFSCPHAGTPHGRAINPAILTEEGLLWSFENVAVWSCIGKSQDCSATHFTLKSANHVLQVTDGRVLRNIFLYICLFVCLFLSFPHLQREHRTPRGLFSINGGTLGGLAISPIILIRKGFLVDFSRNDCLWQTGELSMPICHTPPRQ